MAISTQRKEASAVERNSEVDNQPFYKILQLVFIDYINIENQPQYPEHMDKCLTTEQYPPPVVRDNTTT
jgi:hypothetical protein